MKPEPLVPALTAAVVLTCVDPWGRAVRVPARLGYRSNDPYAVSLTFPADPVEVTWLVARTLLADGLTAPAGQGDVRVRPEVDQHGREVTVLDLSSPDGRLVGEVDSRSIRRFLDRSFGAVPAGTEDRHLDLDGLVAALLEPAG